MKFHWGFTEENFEMSIRLDPREIRPSVELDHLGKLEPCLDLSLDQIAPLARNVSTARNLSSTRILSSAQIGALIKLDHRSNWTLGSECIFGSNAPLARDDRIEPLLWNAFLARNDLLG